MEGGFENSPWFVIVLIGGFAIVFPLFWSAVCLLLSFVSGWRRLARDFATDIAEPRRVESGLMARVGFVDYRSVLTLGRDDDAIYLAVFTLFRPGHTPLRIPLEAVQVTTAMSLFMKRVRIRVADRVNVHVPRSAWERLFPDVPIAER